MKFFASVALALLPLVSAPAADPVSGLDPSAIVILQPIRGPRITATIRAGASAA